MLWGQCVLDRILDLIIEIFGLGAKRRDRPKETFDRFSGRENDHRVIFEEKCHRRTLGEAKPITYLPRKWELIFVCYGGTESL
jgi:hypothetical protein